ncbi:MAG: hypothetical protein AWM53_00971 [Candidatus Dichloromethanomonas elyunquensis]|nr:MAG: hypothetical protein AWM53_00971 [Candidatus Dichloromethanomonas elyunquensis]
MKKSKLVAGILLMVLGVGVAAGSIVCRHYGFSPMNYGHKMITKQHGSFKGFDGKTNPNQNNGQNQNGGAAQ